MDNYYSQDMFYMLLLLFPAISWNISNKTSQLNFYMRWACNFTKSNTPPWVFFTFLKLYKAGLSMNSVRLHLHAPAHASIYLGVLSSHVQDFIWQVNCTPTLQQVYSIIRLQIFHLQLHVKLSFHSSKSIVLYSIWK